VQGLLRAGGTRGDRPGPVVRCRAGLIVGPEDPSNRFPYRVARLARGGEVLAPGSPEDGGFLARDVTDSLAAGLATRPLAETAEVTRRWPATEPDAACRGGLRPEEEAVVLRKWPARRG
jgi:hypothetical protein